MKSILNLLTIFLLALLFACGGETSETTETVLPPETEEPDVPDGAEAPDGPSELEPAGFTANTANDNPKVLIVSGSEISIYDLKTEETFPLLIEDAIMAATFSPDGKQIYFTADQEEFVMLNRVELNGELEPVEIGKLDMEPGTFTSMTYGEPARLEIHKGILYAECGYEWEAFSFQSTFQMPLASEEIKFKEGNNPLYNFHYEGPVLSVEQAEINKKIKNVFTHEGKWMELYYFNSEEDSLQLTETTKYYEEAMESADPEYGTDADGQKFYRLSPNGEKLTFNFMVAMGDLPHGPGMVVNLDGSGQQLLMEDEMGSDSGTPTWLSDSRLLYQDGNDLILVSGPKNEKQVISKGVDSYAVWEVE